MLMLISTSAMSQQFPLTSQYLINPYALTPTLAGVTGSSEVFMGYRKDLVGITGSPSTFRVNGFGNVYQEKMWVGGEIFMDKTDILSLFKAQLSYTYRLQLENEQYLNFGVWGTFYQNSVRTDNTIGVDPTDPLINNAAKLNSSNFNTGFGLNYTWRNLNLGFAFPTLFATKENYTLDPGYYFRMQREILLYGSYLFEINQDWKLQAYGVYRKMSNEPINVDISLMAIYLNRFWLGTLYRNSGAVSLNVGGHIFNGLTFNYAYDIGIGGINRHSGGAHEISIGYRFKFSGNDYFSKKSSRTKRGKSRKSRDLPYPHVQEYNYRKR
jgi:type IX secretion system PorP/SprF family membrane protein